MENLTVVIFLREVYAVVKFFSHKNGQNASNLINFPSRKRFCMDKRGINIELNRLKAKNPGQETLIEGVQHLFNEKVETATPEEKRSLLMFPMQYAAYRIKTSPSEWTTQLHMWADNMLDTILQLNPLYLTTRDSSGDTVLHRLVKAALGEYTDEVNYDFIKKLLDKDMGFVSLQSPFENEGAKAGSVWMMKDVDGCTPMDLLADYAIGKPEAGIPTDDRLLLMLDEFANAPTEEIDVSEVVKPVAVPENPEDEQPAQNAEPTPAVEPKPAENEKAPEEAKHHPTPEARPQETVPNKVTKSVLEALLRL
jgi:hypothetical protein